MKPEKKWRERFVIPLAILIFSAASIVSTNQYHYGIADHSIVIPFLKSSLHPNLYPNDYLLTQEPFYYTYLWSFCSRLIKIFNFNIPLLFFLGYCTAIFFTFSGIYLIAKTLFGKREVAFLSLFFILFSIKILAGSVTIDTVFLTRVAALPVLLFSIYFFLKEKYLSSYLLLGIGFLIHPMTAFYFIAMIVTASLFTMKHIGIQKFLLCLVILIGTSSPILIWKFLHAPSSLNFIYAGQEWIELLRLRSPQHLFPFTWTTDVFIRAGMLLLVFLISWKHKPESRHHRIIVIFVLTAFAMCLAGIIFSEFIPVSIMLNFQLLRSFTFICFLTAIYFANYFLTEFRQRQNVFYKSVTVFMSVGIFYGVTGWKYVFAAFIIFSLFLIFYRILFKKDLSLQKHFAFLVLIVVTILSSSIYIKRGSFSINNAQEKHWLNVQMWAKENTNSKDKFIVPPHLDGFRIESERTIYGDWKDGTLLNFNPEFGFEWFRRMEKLGYKKGSSVENGFRHLAEKAFISIAEEMSTNSKTQHTFLVILKDRGALNFIPVYENEKFIVYRIA